MIPERCWVHPSVEIRKSAIAGSGLFATARIPSGAVVARFGGWLLTPAEYEELFEATPLDQRRVANHDPTVTYLDTIGPIDGRILVLPFGEREHLSAGMHFLNHRCDPTVWLDDAFTLVARRDLMADDEVTVDYSTLACGEGEPWLECKCGSPLCRGAIATSDWRRPELQARYGRHWLPAALDWIREMDEASDS